MKEDLISFKTAKLAKEKRFNIQCINYYFEDGELRENTLSGINGYYGDEYEFYLLEFKENWNDKGKATKEGDRCFGCDNTPKYLETFSAPTQSLLQRWLREEFNKVVLVDIGDTPYLSFEHNYSSNIFDTYEEALEEGLYEALRLI